MRKGFKLAGFLFALGFAAVSDCSDAWAKDTTYYVDDTGGRDDNSGTSPGEAFQTLDKLNSITFEPGDQILFKAGGVWNGQFKPKGSGEEGNPIKVSSYGEGAMPVLNGAVEDAEPDILTATGTSGEKREIYSTIYLDTVEYWEISGLEIMNDEDITTHYDGDRWRAGIRVVINVDHLPEDYDGVTSHIHIKDNYIHDIDGFRKTKDVSHNSLDKEAGGITVQVMADEMKDKNEYKLKARFDDLRIEGNRFENVSILAMRLITHYVFFNEVDFSHTGMTRDDQWSTNVYIGHNMMENVYIDGIIIRSSDHPVIEYNTVLDFEQVKGGVGIWNTVTKNAVIQYNEVAYGHDVAGKWGDGCAFDIDSYSWDTTYQYNYSHDILYGHLMFMGGTSGSTVRYNISENDGYFIRHASSAAAGAPGKIYNNTVYYDSAKNKIFYDGIGSNYEVSNNIFYNCNENMATEWGIPNGTKSPFSHNLIYETSGKHSETEPFDIFAIYSDPKLKAPGQGGEKIFGEASEQKVSDTTLTAYQLEADSPAVNMGCEVEGAPELDFWGNPIKGTRDIGAFELQTEPNRTEPVEYARMISLEYTQGEADSEAADHPWKHATDGDPNTYYQSEDSEAEITVDLGEETEFNFVYYEPGKVPEENQVHQYEIYGSHDGQSWERCLSGRWATLGTGQTAVFEKTAYRYLKAVLKAEDSVIVTGLYLGLDENMDLTPDVTPEGENIILVSEDTFVRGNGTNYGAAELLEMKSPANFDSYARQTLLKFDISGKDLTGEERIFLHFFGGEDDSTTDATPVGAFGVEDSSWEEMSVTGNTRPEVSDTQIGESVTLRTKFDWHMIDVTDYVKGKTESGEEIFTIGLKALENKASKLYSREFGNGMYAPYLEIKEIRKPQALEVAVEGTGRPGEAHTGVYTYHSETGAEEKDSILNWYRSETGEENRDDWELVASGETYVPTPLDSGFYLFFEVTPVDEDGTVGDVSVSQPILVETVEEIGRIQALDDGFARGGSNGNTNYNKQDAFKDWMEVKTARDGNSTYERYAFMKFSLDEMEIPESAKVFLYLYGAKTDTAADMKEIPFTVSLYQTGNAWSSDTLTGNSMPDYVEKIGELDYGKELKGYSWQCLDVTDVVNATEGELSIGLKGKTFILGRLARSSTENGAYLQIIEGEKEPVPETFYTTSIKVTKKPHQMSYEIGEEFDPAGMEVTAYKKATPGNATKKEVLSEDSYEVDYDFSEEGKSSVEVSYEAENAEGETEIFTDSFRVTVYDGEFYVQKIKITKKPDKMTYFVGDEFDPSGMEVTAVRKNSFETASPSNATPSDADEISRTTIEEVLSEDEYEVEYDFSEPGRSLVRIFHEAETEDGDWKEFSATLTVTVKERDDESEEPETPEKPEIPEEPDEADRPNRDDDDDLGSYVKPLTEGTWMKDEIGWWFKKPDGTWPSNQWIELEWNGTASWYFFNEQGYMITGWLEQNGDRYYLHNVSDGRLGQMDTGWQKIDGIWYYFSTISDGRKGHMLKAQRTPDGYWVDETGAWDPNK